MDNEERVFLETRLRNLKRYYRKVLEHADLIDLADDLKSEMKFLEEELQ